MYLCRLHENESFDRLPVGAQLVPMYGYNQRGPKYYRFNNTIHELVFVPDEPKPIEPPEAGPGEFIISTVTFLHRTRRGSCLTLAGKTLAFDAFDIQPGEDIQLGSRIRHTINDDHARQITLVQP